MKSLRHLYKKGIGPSSSHTMGPAKAAEKFLQRFGNAERYKVTLFGSLAMTGKGHGTDRAIKSVFGDKNVEIVFDTTSKCVHPNTMDFVAYTGEEVSRQQYFSIGGGEIVLAGEQLTEQKEVYPHNSFAEIKSYCVRENIDLCEYALRFEDENILDFALDIWETMKNVIRTGLQKEGVLSWEFSSKSTLYISASTLSKLIDVSQVRSGNFSKSMSFSKGNSQRPNKSFSTPSKSM